MIYDRYDDNDRYLNFVYASVGGGVPALVKVAAHAPDMLNKNASDFAVVLETPFGRQYKYPIFDSGNAIASAIYLDKFGANLDPVTYKTAADKVSAALKSFGFVVPDSIEKTASAEVLTQTMSTDANVQAIFGGAHHQEFEVIEEAAANVSPEGRRQLFMQVKEAGLAIPEKYEDYTGTKLGSDFGMAIEMRKSIVRDASQLNYMLMKCASMAPEKLVTELAELDVQHKLAHLYDTFLPDPYLSVYGNSLAKAAKEKTASVTIDGIDVGAEEFGRSVAARKSEIEDAFGSDLNSQLQSDPVNVYNSLPAPHRQAIGKLIKA